MHVVHHAAQAGHAPQTRITGGTVAPALEVPRRAEVLLEAARGWGCTPVLAREHGDAAIAAVHDRHYLDFLRDGFAEWACASGASSELRASLHANIYMATPPRSILGRAGLYLADAASVLTRGSWPSIAGSAQVAIDAANRVLAGEAAVYALCRPPGHHAYADLACGYCFLNNAAIAAEVLRTGFDRVAILDIDVHHGNGTQHIFYRRPDVVFVSVHADPADVFPFYAGYAGERGAGPGEGANLNLPVPANSGDAAYVGAVEQACRTVADSGAGAVVVSLGLDAAQDDPFACMGVTIQGYREMGRLAGTLGRPTVLLQEGGYLSPVLGLLLQAFLDGFAASAAA